METISVTIDIPALGSSFDFNVPVRMPIKNVQLLMVRILSSEYGVSDAAADLVLFDTNDFKALRVECSFLQLSITEGSKLMLI